MLIQNDVRYLMGRPAFGGSTTGFGGSTPGFGGSTLGFADMSVASHRRCVIHTCYQKDRQSLQQNSETYPDSVSVLQVQTEDVVDLQHPLR